MISKRLARKPVEPSRSNVLFDLLIPDRRVVLSEPLAETREIFLRKALHCTSDLFDRAHNRIVPKPTLRGNYVVWLTQWR